jgi:NAD-dependent DNA ligase
LTVYRSRCITKTVFRRRARRAATVLPATTFSATSKRFARFLSIKTGFPEQIEVRGEAFLARSVFQKINAELEMQGEKTFRQSAQFRRRNFAPARFASIVAARRLDLFPYDVLSEIKNVSDALGNFRVARKSRF